MATRTGKDERMKEHGGPIEAAAEYGIDIEQLRDNLTLTVAERLRRHQIALATVEMLRKAKRP
jgi:hypothetical protein